MKSKIFNPFLFTLMVLLAISMASFAQPKKSAKPIIPDTHDVITDNDTDVTINDKGLQLQMKNLQTKMRDLQLKMSKLNKLKFDKTMKLNMKKLQRIDKNFVFKFDSLQINSFKFKDSLLNFVYKFDGDIAPMIAYGFKDFDNNFDLNYDFDSKLKSQDQVEKIKNYSKTYSLNETDIIDIDNKFGKIIVNTWTKNEVKVDVQIKVSTNDDSKAQKLLDNIVIKDSKDGTGVYFKTIIDAEEGNNTSWGSMFKGSHSNSRSIEVNYTIYMPAKSPLTINNKFGNTDLPDLGGKLIINNSFGSLAAKVLSNPGSQIKVKYGNANIGSLNGSDLSVAYGSLDLGDCDKLSARLSYSSAKIGRIKTSGSINVKFGGGLSIAELDKNVKNLAVNSSYSSTKLSIGNDQNVDFDVTVRYGSFNYDDHNVNITSISPSDKERGFNPTKNYKGHLGKGASEKTITINSSFGSVKFD